MNLRIAAVALVAVLATAPPVRADAPASLPYTVLAPSQYQSFVGAWKAVDRPFCAVIASAKQWDAALHPAATMGHSQPFAPPAEFWANRGVLLVARVTYAGDTAHVLRIDSVTREGNVERVNYTFVPNPHASSTIAWWMGAAVAKPLAKTVEFRENGTLVCTVG